MQPLCKTEECRVVVAAVKVDSQPMETMMIITSKFTTALQVYHFVCRSCLREGER